MPKVYFNILLTKFLFYAPVIGIVFPLFCQISLAKAIILAFIAMIACFLTADLVILPKWGNIPAIIGDMLITVAISLIYAGFIFKAWPQIGGVLLLAALIGFGEWYYHRYLLQVFFRGKRK